MPALRRANPPDSGEQALVRLPILLVVGAPAVAFIAAGVWILWNATSTPQSTAFITTPEFLIWWLIVCGQVAAWTLVGGFVGVTVVRRIGALRREGALKRGTVGSVAFALIVLVTVAMAQTTYLHGSFLLLVSFPSDQLPLPNPFPLAGHDLKINVIFAIGIFIALSAVAGLTATTTGFNRIAPGAPLDRVDLVRFLELRDELAALVASAGLLVGMATIATGGLRVAVLAANDQPWFQAHPAEQMQYAPEYVLATGLFFTGLLAIALAPSFVAMRAAGARLREAAHPLPAPTDPTFGDVVASRKVLDGVLQTKLSASATFKVAAAILTPLAGSLLAIVLPGAGATPT